MTKSIEIVRKALAYITKALTKRKVEEIKELLSASGAEVLNRASARNPNYRKDIALQASSPDVKKLNQVVFCESLSGNAEHEEPLDKLLKKRGDVLLAKISEADLAKDLIDYGFSDSGLNIISHGNYKKINRFFWQKDPYKFTSYTNLGTLPALLTTAKELEYGYLSIAGCGIGKKMEKNDICEASKKNPDFPCIIKAGSKDTFATEEFLEQRNIALAKYIPAEIIDSVKKSTAEAISIFLTQIVDSAETGHFLYSGKSFKRNSNYYKKGVSVEQHITESVKNFLNFLHDNKVISANMDKDSYREFSKKVAENILQDELKENPNYVKQYNAKVLVNKFYRKGKIEPEFFENKGYKIADFVDHIRQSIISGNQSESDSIKVIKVFMEKGLDVNNKFDGGVSLMQICTGSNKIKAVKVLVDAGADINAKDKSGTTPLHEAFASGNLPLIEFLIMKGADIKCADNKGITPLQLASKEIAKEILKLAKEGRRLGKISDKREGAVEVETKAEEEKKTIISDPVAQKVAAKEKHVQLIH